MSLATRPGCFTVTTSLTAQVRPAILELSHRFADTQDKNPRITQNTQRVSDERVLIAPSPNGWLMVNRSGNQSKWLEIQIAEP